MDIYCPLSAASGHYLPCHPECRLNQGTKCLLAEYLKTVIKTSDK